MARESGHTLACRSSRRVTHGPSGRVHFGNTRLTLHFSIVSNGVPKTVRDRGLVPGTVHEDVRYRPDRAPYAESQCIKVMVVSPQAQKPPLCPPSIPFIKYAQGWYNCG